MFKVILNGALGADAEVRELGKRKAINFRVAVNKSYKNSEGTKVEKTDWISAVIWRNGDASAKIAEYLKKGTKVLIEGEPGVDAFTGKDGKAAGQLTVTVKEVDFV